MWFRRGERKMSMKVICAWCKKEMGEKEGEGISHGMCESCQEVMRIKAEAEHEKRRGVS